jgi:glyoxylase-like metal-dependent hydrolase (beta-lactamase superfamily II)
MPYHTPGHSPGDVVYYHGQDQVLLAGDLVSSRNGRILPPNFTPVMQQAVRSSSIIGRPSPVRLKVCHGSAVYHTADQLESYLSRHLK